MATTTTRQLREPFVETAGIALTEAALPYLKQAIPTATYTGQQFVAPQTALEQQAATTSSSVTSRTTSLSSLYVTISTRSD
jgi:hypothetical protein